MVTEMKFQSFIFKIAIIVFIRLHLTFSDGVLYFKLNKCEINSKLVHPNATCFAKSYSRTVSTSNCRLFFKRPLYEIFVILLRQWSNITSCSRGVWLAKVGNLWQPEQRKNYICSKSVTGKGLKMPKKRDVLFERCLRFFINQLSEMISHLISGWRISLFQIRINLPRSIANPKNWNLPICERVKRRKSADLSSFPGVQNF